MACHVCGKRGHYARECGQAELPTCTLFIRNLMPDYETEHVPAFKSMRGFVDVRVRKDRNNAPVSFIDFEAPEAAAFAKKHAEERGLSVQYASSTKVSERAGAQASGAGPVKRRREDEPPRQFAHYPQPPDWSGGGGGMGGCGGMGMGVPMHGMGGGPDAAMYGGAGGMGLGGPMGGGPAMCCGAMGGAPLGPMGPMGPRGMMGGAMAPLCHAMGAGPMGVPEQGSYGACGSAGGGRGLAPTSGAPDRPDAYGTGSIALSVAGVPRDATRREVSHIFRSCAGYLATVATGVEPPFIVKFGSMASAAAAISRLKDYRFDEDDAHSPILRLTFSQAR
ncbi:hypothetical protein KFE25_008198 [Diacronema lutheri]|uniref:CCHC-type domain-containing protein n=1 Tax=Diacronema lutheri TaxID=2081491 RepID=A0A8J5XUK7_DIALT|nr:hypothetical protein KFE25_008198 [Diacronema lutheri]